MSVESGAEEPVAFTTLGAGEVCLARLGLETRSRAAFALTVLRV